MTAIPEKGHATLGPSGWGTWSVCPGSIPLGVDQPNKGSRYADEGTVAHQVLEHCLLDGTNAEEYLGATFTVGEHSFIVDHDMADAVNSAIDIITSTIRVENGDLLMAEQEVPLQQLTGEQDAFGTSDVVGICDGGKRLVVGDYKHGKGVKVYATDRDGRPNGQLAMYGLGTLHKYGAICDEIETVELMVIQPRMEWHDTVVISIAELLAFGDEVAQAAGRVELERQAALEGNALTLVPGEKQCRFCKAKGICPALRDEPGKALALVSQASDFDDLSLPKRAASVTVNDGVSAEKLAEFMRAVPLIEEAIKAARGEVERRLFDNLPVPGYYLGIGKQGNRAWVDSETASDELTKSGRLKASEAWKRTPITPTQAEKLLKDRPKIWSKIAPLITQAPGKPSVCREGDKNPVYIPPSSAVEDFSDLTVVAAPTVEDLFS